MTNCFSELISKDYYLLPQSTLLYKFSFVWNCFKRQSFCHITSMVAQGIIEAAGIYLELNVRAGISQCFACYYCTHGWWNYWYDEFRKCILVNPLLHGYTTYNWGLWNKYLDIIVKAGQDFSYTAMQRAMNVFMVFI